MTLSPTPRVIMPEREPKETRPSDYKKRLRIERGRKVNDSLDPPGITFRELKERLKADAKEKAKRAEARKELR